MPGNTLAPRDMRSALTAAKTRKHTRCQLWLTTGRELDFNIEEVIDDAIIGTRMGHSDGACVIPYHAIAMIVLVP